MLNRFRNPKLHGSPTSRPARTQMRAGGHHIAKPGAKKIADDVAYLLFVERVCARSTRRVEHEVDKIVAVMSVACSRFAAEIRHESADCYAFDVRRAQTLIQIGACECRIPVLNDFACRTRPNQLWVIF